MIEMPGSNKPKAKRASATPERERVRITLDLSPAGYKRLQRLAKTAGITSATVLRQALQLYEYVVEQTGQGATFKSVDERGKETDIHFLGYGD